MTPVRYGETSAPLDADEQRLLRAPPALQRQSWELADAVL